MPAAAALVPVFTAIGASTAVATVASAVFVGAAYGAVIGAATSIITGGDILEGAWKGAVFGAVGGAISGTISAVTGAGVATPAAEVADAGAKVGDTASKAGTAIEGADVATEGLNTMASPTTSAIDSSQAASYGGSQVANATQAPVAAAKPGLLERAATWIEKNPNQSELLGRGMAGAAQGLIQSKQAEKDIEALMERDRLNRQPTITDLNQLNPSPAIPSIRGFTGLPVWKLDENGRLVMQNQ